MRNKADGFWSLPGSQVPEGGNYQVEMEDLDRTLVQGTALCPPTSLALGAQSSGGSSPLPLCSGQAVSGWLQQRPWKDCFGTPCFPFQATAGIQTRGC